jgi:ABC-type glycerol-3-phosphate transport system substrate-binding protein
MRRKSGVKAGAALLALSLTLGMLFACASKDSDSSQTSETLASSEETTSEVDVISVLGSMKSVDYQGEVFHIWTSNVINSALTLRQAPDETMDGEQINDALYTRDRLIESKYNIKIQYNIVEPDAEFQLYNKASKVIMSDSGDIHLIFGNMQVYAVEFIKNKLIFDIKSIPEINLSNEWWHQIALRDLDISGKMYFATGDITPRYVFSPFIVLFNKQLFEDYGYEYPYKAVENGTWTMDMILGLIKGTYRDLDGDNRRGLGDFYGFSNEGWAYPFFNGFGDTAMSVSSGEPVINCTTESAVNKIMKVGELFASDDIFFKNERTQYDFSDIFEDNRALLCSQTATNLYLLTDMDTDYGVLPMPKYNESSG